MRIGIVTPAFNAAPYIGDAIRSVLIQSLPDWIMTVVDDGSTDDTAAVVEAFDDPRISMIRQGNAGVSVSRNRGLAATQADLILFLDADDWLHPDALCRLSAALLADPAAVAAVGPYTRRPGPRRVRRPSGGDLHEQLLVQNLFANGGHVLIYRTAAIAAGPFHPGLRYGEDWEFWIRLARVGRFAAAPSSDPLLYVRERHDGAYGTMAAQTRSFALCMDAIFNAPGLRARLTPGAAARLRKRAEAENDWIAGRELIRHGRRREGLAHMARSVRAAPGLKRLAMLAAGGVAGLGVGPFRPYARHEAIP